jgi:uncharacterized membrane protein
MIRTTQLIFALLVALYGTTVSMAFAPTTNPAKSSPTLLKMNKDSMGNALAASFLAAAVLVATVPSEQALAATMDSSQVLAARSGGRMGGRSYSGRMSSPSSRSTTTYSRTTVIRPAAPGVIVAPTYSPFGFNPFFPSPFGKQHKPYVSWDTIYE